MVPCLLPFFKSLYPSRFIGTAVYTVEVIARCFGAFHWKLFYFVLAFGSETQSSQTSTLFARCLFYPSRGAKPLSVKSQFGKFLLPLTQFSVNLSWLCQALVNFPFLSQRSKIKFPLRACNYTGTFRIGGCFLRTQKYQTTKFSDLLLSLDKNRQSEQQGSELFTPKLLFLLK